MYAFAQNVLKHIFNYRNMGYLPDIGGRKFWVRWTSTNLKFPPHK